MFGTVTVSSTCSLSLFIGPFDPSIPEEGPSVLPAGWLDSVTGYEDHKGGGTHLLS